MRLWKSSSYPDSTFAITIIDDSTINIWGNTLRYFGSYHYTPGTIWTADTTKDLMFGAGGDHWGISVDYHFLTDSIFFSSWSGGLGGSSGFTYHAP